MTPADLVYYPVNDFGPLMKGLVIGGLGIFHVFLAQFAIGGGWLMCYFQWLAQRPGTEPALAAAARRFLDSYFVFLILVSFVVGALTGVGMWFTSIQISAPTIGLMIAEFHWIWATEWTFFVIEIVAGYAFYRYGRGLDDRARMTLLVLYSIAAWMSLFWINGILAWQLTPGGWVETGSVWPGFFNPSFWPSLLYRTAASMAIAALVAAVVINTMTGFTSVSSDLEARTLLINRAAHFLVPMLAMPLLGLWYLAVIPADSRSWVLGGSVPMTMFMNLAAFTSILLGAYALIGLVRQKLYINGATATLLAALAFAATAGGEFVREGVRKPFTVRQALYSNSITPRAVRELRAVGSVSHDPYPLRNPDRYPNDQIRLGAKVFRFQCSVCHTEDGVNGLAHLTGTWNLEQKRMNIAQLQDTKAFMPPFAGTPEEAEALVQMLEWLAADRPARWPESREAPDYPEVLRRIEAWLDEAGVEPGSSRVTAAGVRR